MLRVVCYLIDSCLLILGHVCCVFFICCLLLVHLSDVITVIVVVIGSIGGFCPENYFAMLWEPRSKLIIFMNTYVFYISALQVSSSKL